MLDFSLLQTLPKIKHGDDNAYNGWQKKMLFVLHTMWQFIPLWTVFFLHFLLFTLLVSFCLLYSDGKIDRIFKPAISMLLADITMHSKHWNLQIASFLWNTPTISDLNYVIAELLYHKPRLSNSLIVDLSLMETIIYAV